MPHFSRTRLYRWFSLAIFTAVLTVLFALPQGLLPSFLRSAAAAVAIQSVQIIPETPTRTIPHSPISSEQISYFPEQFLQQGREYYIEGKFVQAIDAWNEAIKYLYRGGAVGRAIIFNNLALAHYQLGEWPQAEEAIRESFCLLKSTDDTCKDQLDEQSQFFERDGQAQNLISCPSLYSFNLDTIRNQSSEVLRVYGQASNTRGSLYLAKGNPQCALDSWQQATALYEQGNYTEGAIKSLINQTYALRSLGFFIEARDQLVSVEKRLDSIGDQRLKLSVLQNLGETLRLMGDLDTSESKLYEALEIAVTEDEKAQTQLSLGNTLRMKARQQEALAERTRQAVIKADYDSAIDKYANVPDTASPRLRVNAQLNQLNIHLYRENWNAAQTVQSRLSSDIETLPLGRTSVFAHLKFAKLLMDGCSASCRADLALQPSFIYTLLDAAKSQSEILQDTVALSYTLGYLGNLYELEGKLKDAQRFTEAALELSREQPTVAYQWHWQLGRIEKQLGLSLNRILQNYDAAFSRVEKIQEGLLYLTPDSQSDFQFDVPFDFLTQVEPLYREYLSLLLFSSADSGRKSLPGPQDKNKVVLQKAQAVIDDLRIAELQSFLACGLLEPAGSVPTSTIHDIAADEQKTAIIYTIILPDDVYGERLEVLIERSGQDAEQRIIKRYSVPSNLSTQINIDDFEFEASSTFKVPLEIFRQELEQPYFSSKRAQPLAEALYDLIIRPAENDGLLNSIDHLVFVLDGPLRNVPMASLYDRDQQKFLIEKYAISVTFGDLQLPTAKPGKTFSVLAGGLSEAPQASAVDGNSANTNQNDSFEDFGPLVYVETEVRAIESSLDDVTVLLNEDFNREKIQNDRRAANHNILHLATHGEFGFTRNRTFLVAATANPESPTEPTDTGSVDKTIPAQKINLNDFDTLFANRDRASLDLLVLSACETATGDSREVLGIAGLAVQSGARSTLASLWSINDLSTSTLMETFYKKLRTPEVSKAQALQQAQIELLRKGYKPSKWAPYLLVGDWR